MTLDRTKRKLHDGRDEMNLADFPISALQRVQPRDERGEKIASLEYEATRYDPTTRQRLNQRVTLTTTAREGLPTPADEHVILALLCVAKHSNNFADVTVHFAPGQLFEIMGWAPNGRSYTRLRDVLRRLKALNIRYENAWWDAAGRHYEEEVATGIVAGYRIARQVSGPRHEGTELQSWVSWTPQFHESLKNGNIKRLNLEVYFGLSSPTAQRMYRFLDKRFYNSPRLVMDLVEFACGHVGLTESHNVAILKRRLAPAIEELEGINFLERMSPQERYQKVKPGVWRVQFQAAQREPLASGGRQPPGSAPVPRAVKDQGADAPRSPEALPAAETLACAFYRLWDVAWSGKPGGRDLEQAATVLAGRTEAEAHALIPLLVQVTRKEWPDCRSFSGAVQKYLYDAVKLAEAEQRREAQRRDAQSQRSREQEESAARQAEERRRAEAWEALPADEREAIRRRVLERLGGAGAPEAFLRRLCLQELPACPAAPPADGLTQDTCGTRP